MAKYKLCPMCNTKNQPSVLECTECGNDLMGIKLLDDAVVAKVDDCPEIQNKITKSALVRICDCGAENEVSSRKCTVCGEDISDIIPVPAQNTHQDYCLTSVDGCCKLQLACPGSHIIGREHELAGYLSNKPFVSRLHAIITVTVDGVYVENRSRANGTFLNNEKLNDNMAYKLCEGDEIGLGGFCANQLRQNHAAYFVMGRE